MNAERLKVLQFIVASLMMGVVVFAMISLLVGGMPQPADIRADSLSVIGVVLSIACAAMSLVVARALDRATENALLDLDNEAQRDEQLSERLQQRTIIGCALLEGAIFLNLVLNVLQRNLLLLLCAAALLALMSFYFPTSARVQRWFSARREGVTDHESFR